jgi:hypothetical protein
LAGLFNALATIGRQLLWGGNVAPTAVVGPTTQTTDGVVTGAVIASDGNGDPLTYRVSATPSSGTVALDAKGGFVYTPNAALASAGGTDTFAVTVDDGHYGPTGRTTAVVSVDVEPPNASSGQPNVTFQVVNLTHYSLTFKGYSGAAGYVHTGSGPAVGDVLLPGAIADFAVDYVVLGSKEHTVTAIFTTPDGATFSADLTSIDGVGGGQRVACNQHSGGACGTSGNNLVNFLDNPGTTISLTPDASTVDFLNRVCGKNLQGDCDLNLISKNQKVYGPTHLVGVSVVNSTGLPLTTTFSYTETVGATDSLSVNGKLSANVAGIISAEISASGSGSYTQTHTYSQTFGPVTVDPGWYAYADVKEPFLRSVGNFTVTMGNTTYHINGVVIDVNDPNGQDQFFVHDAKIPTKTALQDVGLTASTSPHASAVAGSMVLPDSTK